MQVALLRVLQQREFARLGGNETKRVDVRLVDAAAVETAAPTCRGGDALTARLAGHFTQYARFVYAPPRASPA